MPNSLPAIFKAALHEPPIDYRKLIAKCDYYHGNSMTCNCGVGHYRRLPLLVTELICKCSKNYYERCGSLSAKGGSLGTYCLDCGKPNLGSIKNNHYRCEGCNKYFTFDWRAIDWLPKQLLCKDCDVPVARPGVTTSGFSFD